MNVYYFSKYYIIFLYFINQYNDSLKALIISKPQKAIKLYAVSLCIYE